MFGCADLVPPPDTEFSVSERNVTTSIVTCNVTGVVKTWSVTCEDDVWVGNLGNCSSREQISALQPPSCRVRQENHFQVDHKIMLG